MCADIQDFADISDLTKEGVSPQQYSTLEYNYWKLDGNFLEFPNNPENIPWGLWSKSLSNENGEFETPIELELNFSELHSTIGLSFEFNPYGPDWCNDLIIKWLKDDVIINEKEFYPDRWNYSAMQKVENFNKIIVTFKKMSKPYRYLKIQNVIYGIIKYFEDSEIIDAEITEEIDLTSTSIPYNQLSFTIFSKNNEFDIFNPQGVYTLLQKKQQLNVTGYIDNIRIFYGYFYVDEISQNKDKTLTIDANDAISIMDSTNFYGGIYNNTNIISVLDNLFNTAGFVYSIEESLINEVLTGYIPYSSHREALNLICLSIGAYATTSMNGNVVIKKINDIPEFIIDKDRKIISSSVKYNEYISGVEVTAFNYEINSEEKSEIYKGNLTIGNNTIIFSKPVSNESIESNVGEIIEKGETYCIINSDIEQEAIIKAYEYIENKKIYRFNADDIIAGEKENIKQINDCTLINDSNALIIAQRLYNIFQKRIKQTFSIIPKNGQEIPGKTIQLYTGYDSYRPCTIEKITIDLAGGHISDLDVLGE